jgi:hypothetical protein
MALNIRETLEVLDLFNSFESRDMKSLIIFFFLFCGFGIVHAQNGKPGTPADSIKIVKRLQELLFICRNVDFADPKTSELGLFYKAAPYMAYRGEDKARNWKDAANYKNPEEKKGVDDACFKINQTLNQDSAYKIERYMTQAESEGIWHVLLITYMKKGKEKKVVYAFIKVKDEFVLGDIDQQ